MNAPNETTIIWSDLAQGWVSAIDFIQWVDTGTPLNPKRFAIFRAPIGICYFHESRLDRQMKEAIAAEIEKRNAATTAAVAHKLAEEQKQVFEPKPL